MSTLGERLKTLRTTFGLSQADIADYLAIDRSAYCCYEIQKAKPDILNLIKLSRIFNVSTDFLLLGDEEVEEKFIQYQKDRTAFFLNETLLTLSPCERALIIQFRLLPNREDLLELVHQNSVKYFGKEIPGLHTTKRKRRTNKSNEFNKAAF